MKITIGLMAVITAVLLSSGCAQTSKKPSEEFHVDSLNTKFIKDYSGTLNNEPKFGYKPSNYGAIQVDAVPPIVKEEKTTRVNFPKNFKGDSIVSLIKKAEKIDKKMKDEFTKTSELNQLFSQLNYKTFTFIFTGDNYYEDLHYNARYNADEESLYIEVMGNLKYFDGGAFSSIRLVNNVTSRNYIGQNGYGAITDVTSKHNNSFGLAFTNIGKDGGEYHTTILYSLSTPVNIKQAKSLKNNVSVYLTVELENIGSNQLILKDYGEVNPTIADPVGGSHLFKCLPVKLKEVGFFKRSTGEILGHKMF